MTPHYTRLDMEQGTARWLAWRTEGIGASEAPAIMGENPWKSRKAVLREKLGLTRRGYGNAAMAFGTQTEPEARARYVRHMGVHVEPACVQSLAHPWLRASLDGLSPDGQRVMEIKCGPKVHAFAAEELAPPRYYYGQLQHILAVTGLHAIDFWCYLPGLPHVHVEVARDEAYIARMLEVEQAFWREVLEGRNEVRE